MTMRMLESLVALILVLTIILFGFLIIIDQFIDPTNNTDPAIAEASADTETSGFNLMVKALSSIDENGVATLHIDEYDINELLYSFKPMLDLGEIKARGLYVEEGESGHRLCMPISAFGIDTMISGGLSLYLKEELICLTVSDLRLARVSLGSDILSSFNVEGLVTSALAKIGLNCEFSGDSLTVRLSREDIGGLVARSLKNDPNAELFMVMYNLLMLKSEAVSIDIADPTDITVTLDLGLFGVWADGGLASVNTYTKGLLSRKVIGRESAELVANYYVNGYSGLSADEQARIKVILSAEKGADEIVSHKGLISRESFSITDLLLHQLDVSPDALRPGFKIADSDINAMLSDLPLIGRVWQFASSRDNSCAYIAVKDVYCSIADNLIKVFVDIDLNGHIMRISADFLTSESTLVAIPGMLGEVCIGELKLEAEEVDLIFAFLSENLREDWIYIDGEARMLTLDFTSTFEDNLLLGAVLSTSRHIVTSCEKSLISDGGFVYMVFNLF